MKKALIVDDNEQNLYLLETMMKGQGYDVMIAANGVEALEQARRDPPDIIISDILMPVMDGFALCREWRADERLQYIPFVFYTATYTDPNDEELALSLGAARFIVKPQVPEAFLALVRQVVEERGTGRPLAPLQAAPEETDYYKLYNEALVRKLEDKMLALEESNRALEQEITMRKKAEETLHDTETRYRLLFEHSPDGAVIIDPVTTRLLEFNESAFQQLGYSREEFAKLTILDIEAGETSEETTSHIATGVSDRRDDFDTRHRTKQGEIKDIHVTAQIIEILGHPVYHCLWRDITDRKKAEENLKEAFDRLRKAFGTTIQVMVSAVETRDPYTAGHQVRSADLARTIATEMELHQEKIDAIRMAGTIHDIGKLSIPAEILSKPTKLSDIEFQLIKEHAKKGYDILKDVESPWPLAEIVYQHHERIDGSGYPRNRQGEEILIEARILAVADVVEAMASHRPYRPAFGIDVALAEIEKYKGIHYDADVVDACLRMFREKGYELPQR